MTDEALDQNPAAIALRREIAVTRAEMVTDIDRLRRAVREQLTVRHFLRTHPRFKRALGIGLALAGVGVVVLIVRAARSLHHGGNEDGARRVRRARNGRR